MATTRALPPISIQSLRGGLNDIDPPAMLPPDQCPTAENVEFFYSTLGERRGGCTAIGLPSGISGNPLITTATGLFRHLPTTNLGDAELWAYAESLDGANTVLTQRTQTAWSTIVPNDAITASSNYGTKIQAISLHGKLYFAYKSAFDRLHVWDGTTLRRTSVLPPAVAPTAMDSGGAGALTGTRYYRVRFSFVSGPTVLRHGEPSPVLTFTPSGANASVTITKPPSLGEGETSWELEASTDNANFYLISTQLVGVTTYVDSTNASSGYASQGVLSDNVTANTVLPSARLLSVDADRLILGGSFENSLYDSRIWWTPVLGATGFGNDERLDMTVNPYIDLDGFDGGSLTCLSKAFNGFIYAFKWSHIYKVVRSGQLTNAYEAIPISQSRGALPNSLVQAVDQTGSPALYFLDPAVGPMRISPYGVEWLGRDLRTTWSRVNTAATIPCHGVYHTIKNQVHFWIAVDGSDHPNMKIVVHCGETQSTYNEGARRGWVTVPKGDRIADAYCSVMFSPNVDSTDPRDQNLVPFIGKTTWMVNSMTIGNIIQRCDVGTTDCFTPGDTDAFFYGRIQTRPFTQASLISKFGVLSGTLMCASIIAAPNDLLVRADCDFGLETKLVKVDMSPKFSEPIVIKQLDNFSISECRTVQITFGDLDTSSLPESAWQLHFFQAKTAGEQTD
jgi:hypothetical protein